MASLGARVDVVEPARAMASAMRLTVQANCWEKRVTVHEKGITANESADGTAMTFSGGWRLDDRAQKRKDAHRMELLSIQRLLRADLHGRVDLLKIDIDNAKIERRLVIAVERMVAERAADISAIVMELADSGDLGPVARALSRLQLQHGYHVYRLAHHLHTLDKLESWYSPCVAARALKYALYIRRLEQKQWARLLYMERDKKKARADTISLLLSKQAIGVGAEARWADASMLDTLPAHPWRSSPCGHANDSAAAPVVESIVVDPVIIAERRQEESSGRTQVFTSILAVAVLLYGAVSIAQRVGRSRRRELPPI